MSKIDLKNLDSIKKINKKGQPLMMFITVSGEPTKQETEQITTLWQNSLFNANFEVTRYMLEHNKAIFMVNDGATAWDIKDFLVKQDRCLQVVIDNETFPGEKFKDQDNKSSSKVKTPKTKSEF